MKKTLILLTLVALFGCSKEPNSMDDFTRLVGKIQSKSKEIGNINMEIADAVQKFNANRKEDEQIKIPDSAYGLNKEQLKLVQDMIQKEQDPTYRGLLTQIVDKNKQIQKLSEDLEDVKAKLPKPYSVKEGDSHYNVCFNFLTKEKGLSKERANELLQQSFLADDLLPGFNVWLYYNDDVFGTFVNQGSVKISPNQFARIIRKKQIDAARQEVMEQMKNGEETPKP